MSAKYFVAHRKKSVAFDKLCGEKSFVGKKLCGEISVVGKHLASLPYGPVGNL